MDYTPLIWIGGPVFLFVTLLYFLRADPKEVEKRDKEFFRRLYGGDPYKNSRR